MPVRTRAVAVLAASLLLGAVLAWATDQGGAGVTVLSQLRNTVGGLSTPWVLLPFVAGAAYPRRWAGALAGLLATMSALTGWYLCATALEDLGGHGVLGDLRLEFRANLLWFLAGLVSGPLFGAFGSWWRARRRLPAAVVAGALLIGEPVVMFALTAAHSVHLLHNSTAGGPLIALTNYAVTGPVAAVVLVCELVLGGVVVALALRRGRPTATGVDAAG